LAGTPPNIENGSTSLLTNEFALIIEPLPILTPLPIVQLEAIQTSSSIITFLLSLL
tara:strand:- start:137 stop:304 length:168 start_codon:yes stop_codon:yes gene_type:complete